jgi:hypothetical protein
MDLSLEEDSATFGKPHKKAQPHKTTPNDQEEDTLGLPEVSPLPRPSTSPLPLQTYAPGSLTELARAQSLVILASRQSYHDCDGKKQS